MKTTQLPRINQMAIPENNKLDREYLRSLEKRVVENKALADDYKNLDDYIQTGIGVQKFILRALNEEGLSTYQQYIDERKQRSNTINIFEGALVGKILGAIQVLKSQL
jgi:uncharacterized protein YeeX (DUF496 family)